MADSGSVKRQPHRRVLYLSISLVMLIWGGIGPAVLTVPGAVAASRPSGSVASARQERAVPSASRSTSVRIYLIALGDNGRSGRKIGCGDSLIPVTLPIPPTTAPLTAALRLLLKDHHAYYGQSGLYNPLYQATLRLRQARVKNGKAIVHFTGRLNLRGVCDDPRVAGQLRQTVRQFPTIRRVAIYVNNVPLRKVLSGR